MKIEGGCHCGAIGYAAEIDPARVSVCHCTDCQQLTGSPYRVTVLCDRENIELRGEAPAVYGKSGQSGRVRLMYFCRRCGTPLFASAQDGQGEWGIRWGSIQQRGSLTPGRQIWTASALSWIAQVPSLPDGGTP